MNDPIVNRWARCVVPLLCLVLLVLLPAHMNAQDDRHQPNDNPVTRVLFVGHLNFDCYRDTVVGSVDPEQHYLPSSIHWGAAAVADASEDSACASATPKRSRIRTTDIQYPRWKRITGSVAFVQMNEDSLADIVFFLWGRYEQGNVRRDSARVLALFGQQGLDSIRSINLESIGRFQSERYVALEMVEGTDVVNPEIRDLSGFKSFELKPHQVDVRGQRDSAVRHMAPPIAGVAMEQRAVVRLFPNPASSLASLAAKPIAPGTYTIEIISANGRSVLMRTIEVESSRDLLSTFDVSDLPSGYYIARLSGREKTIGNYPIIVTR